MTHFGFGKKVTTLFMLLALTAAPLVRAETAATPSPAATESPALWLEVSPAPTGTPEAAAFMTLTTPEAPEQSAPTVAPAPETTPEVTPMPIEAAEIVESRRQDDGVIRVKLSSLGSRSELNLTTAGAYAVEGDAGFRFERGAQLILFEDGGSVWLRSGGLSVCMGSGVTLTRHADGGEAGGLYIAESEKDALYCGDLQVSAVRGALECVLHIGVEEYLLGVVAYEMSDGFPLEALKAQAVAARTYALQRKYAAGTRSYDVVDTTADQVYKGFDPRYTNVISAVEATRGVVGVYNGAFATCYYTASNGGQVATPNDVWGGGGDYGYIEMHDDPFDLENPKSIVNSVEFARDLSDNAALKEMLEACIEEGELAEVTAVSLEEPIREGSRMYKSLRFDLKVLVEVETEDGGFVPGLSFLEFFTSQSEPETEERDVQVTLSVYEDIKDGLNIGLNSSDYELLTVVETETGFALEMRRFGHGTGMSQRGAQQMAGEHSYSWRQILHFYYPGMQLERMEWNAPELTELESIRKVEGYARPKPTPGPTPAPLPALEDGEYYAAVALESVDSTLNIRQEPNTGAMVLDRFEAGRRLIVCTEPDAEGWVQVRTAEITGWCKLEYLQAE